MAAFTSNGTGGGNWNTLATWTDGSNYPGELDNDDTFTIVAGDTVTYNVSEAHELGDSTIAGLLTFKTDADTKLCFGSNTLTISDGGELRIGASGAVIAAANTAELVFNTAADNTKGISVADGGKLTVYGDPTYYGSDDEDALANDAENTDGDAVIKTKTDMSAKWNVGDVLTLKIENAGDASSYTDAILTGIIQSFAGTLITLDINVTCAAGVGSTWESPVIDVSRNVTIYKSGYVWRSASPEGKTGGASYYNSNRPRIYDVNADGNNNCVVSNAQISGFYAIDSDYDFQFLASIFRNGYQGFNGGSGNIVSGNVYANYQGFNGGSGNIVSGNVYANNNGFNVGSSHIVSGNVYANSSGFNSGSGHIVSGNVYANNYGFNVGSGHIVSGNVYANAYGFIGGSGHIVSGRIGYTSGDVSQPNSTSDFYVACIDILLLNAKLPLAGLNIQENQNGQPTEIFCEHHNRTLNAQRIYQNMGNSTVVACDNTDGRPSQDPDGGAGNVIELSNVQSGCNTTLGNTIKAWRDHTYRIWATSAGGAKTYTFKVQTTYAGITAGNLKLTAEYLNGVSEGSTATETNAPAINERANAADWTQTLAVTITPGEDGWIDFKIELMEYESGDEVWIWPEVAIT